MGTVMTDPRTRNVSQAAANPVVISANEPGMTEPVSVSPYGPFQSQPGNEDRHTNRDGTAGPDARQIEPGQPVSPDY